MARSLTKFGGLSVILATAVLLVGCGIKGNPMPRSEVAPAQVTDLRADSLANGVEVSFSAPQREKPDLAIETVRLYYGYLPVGGDPDCPPCPPKLRQYHDFDLTADADNVSSLMKGGRFAYLDANAPMNMQAVYGVVLIDAGGRQSPQSAPARVLRVEPSAAPTGLWATPDDGLVGIAWQPVKTLIGGQPCDDVVGYLIWRKDESGEKRLNSVPIKAERFVDKTVRNGVNYAYRVQSARGIGGVVAPGEFSDWLDATPKDDKAPETPQDVSAVSQTEGVFINFRPSPDRDVQGYLIFRRVDDAEANWVQITELIKDTYYTDSGVEIGARYFYKVLAIDASGNRSEMSVEADVLHKP